MTTARWRLGIDIGGTFTDVAALDPATGTSVTAKVRTRVGAPLESLRAALAAVGFEWESIAVLVHGTTLVTNAIVEDRLPAVALVATEGFGDVLAIGRQNRRALYSLNAPPKLPPLVPEPFRFEIKERTGPDGRIRVPVQPAVLKRLVEAIRHSGVSSVAVSLLHAYANPASEQMVGECLAAVVPYVALSHLVNPEEREYERTSATVLNAAVMPLVGCYLDELDREVPGATQFHLFHSAGGMASTEMVRKRPLVLALSGPAAGVSAACQVARDMALDNALTLDMGGTTTDVCLIRRGQPEHRHEVSLAGRPVRQTMVAVQSIGAGGGSIAYAEAGMLRVGPRSVGASPGPACYGLGGIEPTVTDANLVLGYLDADKPLPDGVQLDRDLAAAAVGRLADRLSLNPIETALGIVRVANANMVRAIRNVTVDRGIDGRSCTLVAFGGCGPMHAATLARDFGIRSVVVPAFSSTYSALGCVLAKPSSSQQRTVRMARTAWSGDSLAWVREALIAEMKFDDGSGEVAIEDTALVRYAGQSYSVEVPYCFPPDVATLTRGFQEIHKQLYGFATGEDWELEAIRVTAWVASSPVQALPPPQRERVRLTARARTPCWFSADGSVETPRYSRDALAPATRLAGPAIIEDEWSTVTLPPGAMLEAVTGGHLVLSFKLRL